MHLFVTVKTEFMQLVQISEVPIAQEAQ